MREWTLFDKIWVGQRFFNKKSQKKGHPFDFFDPCYGVVLTEVTFFMTKYEHDSRGFSWKIKKKMTLDHRVFERMDICFTKYGHDSSDFF